MSLLGWIGFLVFSLPWTVVRESSVPLPPGVEASICLDANHDGVQDLLLVSTLPGQSRLLENPGTGVFVETPAPVGLLQSPGFLSLVPLRQEGSETLLAGVEVLTPTVLRMYRGSEVRWEEVAEVLLPAAVSGDLVPLDSTTLLVPLETGVWQARVDSLAPILKPLLYTGQPVLSLQAWASDSGDLWLLVEMASGWALWQDGQGLHSLAGAGTVFSFLPVSDVPEAVLVSVDTAGLWTLWSDRGLPLARQEALGLTRLHFLPVWDQGLLGWGTTGQGEPVLVRFVPSLLQVEFVSLDTLGEGLWPLDPGTPPAPRFLVFQQDSARLVSLQGDFWEWRLPPDFEGALQVFGALYPLRVRRGMPQAFSAVLFTGTADSACWLLGDFRYRLSLPAPGHLVPLEVAGEGPGVSAPVSQNLWVWPNPAHGRIRVEYQVAEPTLVEVLLCRSDGQVLRVLDRSVRDPGRYEVEASLEGLPPGQYLIVCRRGNEVENRKVVLIP